MVECPKVGPRECNFNPGSDCTEGRLDHNGGKFEKPCEICDIVIAYWERRKMPDCTRPGKCFFKENGKCSRDFGSPCPDEEAVESEECPSFEECSEYSFFGTATPENQKAICAACRLTKEAVTV